MENPKIIRPPDQSTTAAVVGGVPLAFITVWLLNNVWLPPHHLLLDAPAATAFGSLGAAIFGEVWVILRRLIDKLLPGPADRTPPEDTP